MKMIKEQENYKEIALNRFKNMSAGQKLNLSLRLYASALELKKASMKELHPGLTQKEIEKRVKEIFFYART